jgi:hypothetical protein
MDCVTANIYRVFLGYVLFLMYFFGYLHGKQSGEDKCKQKVKKEMVS